jgi:hypothetical protein
VIPAHADLVTAIDLAERHVTAAVDIDWWSDPADNLVTTSDFESGTSGWTGVLSGFTTSTLAQNGARSYLGTRSLRVTWPTTSVGSAATTIVTTTPGQQYRLQAWVFAAAGQPAPAPFVHILIAGTAITQFDGWVLSELIFTAPNTSHTVGWYVPTATSGQQAWIDEVRCVPYLDHAPLLGTVRVSRSLSASLPDIAGIATGDVSAEATVELAGVNPALPGSASAVQQFQPFNADSLLWRRDRTGRPAAVEVGMLTESGERRVRRFTGLTRAATVDPLQGAVTVTALDYAELLRAPASLPTVVGSATISAQTYRPGLNAQWVVDHLLRQGGVAATPRERPSCALSATLHGSAAAEVGTLVYAYDTTAGNTVGYTQGAWALATYDPATAPSVPVDSRYGEHTGWSARWLVSDEAIAGDGLTSGTSDGMLVEAWVYLPASSVTRDVLTVESDPASGSRQKLVLRLTTAFILDWYTTAAGAAVTVTGPTLTYDGAWHYLAALVSWPTSTTVRVTFRVDGTSTTPADGAVTARTTQTAMTHVTVTAGLCMEALQVTGEVVASAAPFDDEFVPGAVLEPSLLELTVTPQITTGTSLWDVIKQVAEAEAGIVGFDEAGIALYRNRRTAPDAPGRTITADRSLSGFRTVERIDSIRNRIRVPVSGYALQSAGFVWSAADTISVGSRATRTVIVEFADPVVGLSTTVVVVPLGGNTSSRSGYRAARRPDGTGGTVTNLVFTVTPLGTSAARVAIRNPNGYPVYLVSPTGAGYPSTSDGTPTLELWGQPITATATNVEGSTALASSGVAEAVWQPSIDLRGEQLLDVPPAPWRQNGDDAQALADDLLFLLHRPVPVIEQVDASGDPTIQLGDRTVLSDPQFTGLDDPVIVVACDESVDPAGGYGQSLTVRLVAPPGGWILGYAGRSTLAVSTRL